MKKVVRRMKTEFIGKGTIVSAPRGIYEILKFNDNGNTYTVRYMDIEEKTGNLVFDNVEVLLTSMEVKHDLKAEILVWDN